MCYASQVRICRRGTVSTVGTVGMYALINAMSYCCSSQLCTTIQARDSCSPSHHKLHMLFQEYMLISLALAPSRSVRISKRADIYGPTRTSCFGAQWLLRCCTCSGNTPFNVVVKSMRTNYQSYHYLDGQCFGRYAAEVYFGGGTLLANAVIGSLRACAKDANAALRHVQPHRE